MITYESFKSLDMPSQRNFIQSGIDNRRIDGIYDFIKWKSLKHALEVCKPEEYADFALWLGYFFN